MHYSSKLKHWHRSSEHRHHRPKLWNYCNVLRDDGVSYGDYVEQLTYLLFLNMADERTRAPYNQKNPVPEQYGWPSLIKKDGDELFDHYRHTLEALGSQKGLLGLIFNKSQKKFQDPAKLRRLVVDLIDKEQWVSMSADVKGDACEGLLERNAQDTKSGACQYFTPRPLIEAIVDVMAPKPGETICDPACGASETIRRKLPHECDVHTLLRFPTGLFYAQGVKANVLFFDKKPASENVGSRGRRGGRVNGIGGWTWRHRGFCIRSSRGVNADHWNKGSAAIRRLISSSNRRVSLPPSPTEIELERVAGELLVGQSVDGRQQRCDVRVLANSALPFVGRVRVSCCHDRHPDSAIARRTPMNPTPILRASAVAANRAVGSFSPATRELGRAERPRVG